MSLRFYPSGLVFPVLFVLSLSLVPLLRAYDVGLCLTFLPEGKLSEISVSIPAGLRLPVCGYSGMLRHGSDLTQPVATLARGQRGLQARF